MPTACFLLPHPDDEFAITALIRDRRRAGVRVSCIYLTDGAYGGQSPARRRGEALRGLASLGVPPEDVHFFGEAQGIGDGSLHLHLQRALDALLPVVMMDGTPDELFCPAWEGGHQDHDAVHLVALALHSRLPSARLRQFSIYHGAGLPGPLFRVMKPLPANGATEDRAGTLGERLSQIAFCFNYPSQWKTFLGLMPGVAWRMLSDGRWRTQPVNPSRVLESPHEGRPLYDRRGFLGEVDFRRHAELFINANIPSARR